MKMMYYSVSDTGMPGKNLGALIRGLAYDLSITSPDALPLSHRRLVRGKGIKLGSWDTHPTYC